MPSGTVSSIRGAGQAQAMITPDQTQLTVADLAPGTLFRIFAFQSNPALGFSRDGRMFVKSAGGRGIGGKLLKDHYNGDVVPIAIVVPLNGQFSDRAWTPATDRLTPDTPVMETYGVLSVNL